LICTSFPPSVRYERQRKLYRRNWGGGGGVGGGCGGSSGGGGNGSGGGSGGSGGGGGFKRMADVDSRLPLVVPEVPLFRPPS